MRNPALRAVIAFSTGIIFSHFVIIPLNYTGIALLGGCLVYLILGIVKSKYLNLLSFIIIGIAGMLWYEVRTTLFPENHIKNYLYGCNIRVVGQIIREPDVRENQTILECEAESIFVGAGLKPIPTTGKIIISLKYPETRGYPLSTRLLRFTTAKEFEYGDIIESYGKLWFPEFPRNPGSFDYGAWLKQNDIYAQMSPDVGRVRIIGKHSGNPIISKIALPIKRQIRNTIDKYLGWIQGPFLKAIVIGDRGIIPKRIYEYFQNTGVVHIIAISGTQVAIIAVIIFTILSIFRIPLIPKQIITSVFLIIYAFITGLQPPIVRSTIMSIFVMVALTIERDSSLFNVMGFAGLFILFINPQALFDIGFQLSFAGVFYGVYLYPKIYPLIFKEIRVEEAVGIKKLMLQFYRSVTQLFTFSLCAQLGVTPIVAYNFFKLPIISIIANLFVIPLTGVCISLTFIMSIFNLLPWQIPVHIFASATWAVTTFTIKIVEWFDKIPYAYLWIGRPSIFGIGFYYLLLLSLVNFPISITARKVFLYGLLIFVNLTLWSKVQGISDPTLKITYLDVKHGDCTFIELPDRRKILIDAGPAERNWDAGTYIIAPFLRAKGISNIDFLIATNPKIYRIGGMRYIIENFKVKEFICPATPHHSWTWLRLLKLLKRKRINCKIIDTNNISIKLDYKNISFLFAGDDVLAKLPRPYPHFTVLSVPRHGSKRCFSSDWVRDVTPQFAIISCGKNPWHEPDTNVIKTYKSIGAKILRTDEEGAITITIPHPIVTGCGGDTLQIETMKQLYWLKPKKLLTVLKNYIIKVM